MSMNNSNQKFDFDDVSIIPAVTSSIKSRSEVNPFINGKLPIISSPMYSVISKDLCYNKNIINDLEKNLFEVCIPRDFNYSTYKNIWISVSLETFEHFIDIDLVYEKILVDIANGHSDKILNLLKRFKINHPYIEVMIGNIANPETYRVLSDAGSDYVRVGIGAGAACTTSANGAIHYPMGSLIDECYQIAKTLKNPARIVADGGFKNYSDIIKALSLGSDYVMLGGILSKTLESDNPPLLFGKIKITNIKLANWLYKYKFTLYKEHYGMSTKRVQKLWGKKKLKTSEGTQVLYKINYTLNSWAENFTDYLKSAMSYTNSTTLEEFKNCEKIFITQNAHKRFNK